MNRRRLRFIEKLRKREVVDAAPPASGRQRNESIIIVIRISHFASLVHCTSIAAFNCFGLFCYLDRPPASAEPSEEAAIAIGEGLAPADPRSNAV
jgi:hypothetical protein